MDAKAYYPGIGDLTYCSGITNPTAIAEAYKRRTPVDPRKIFKGDSRLSPRATFETCIISPFAGKDFCLNKYLKGIDRLPKDKNICAVIYDNSNSIRFRKRLVAEMSKRFPSYLCIIDENQKFTVENTKDYFLIDDRMYEIYGQIARFIPFSKNVLIIEDDIEIPENTYEKLSNALNTYPEIGTVVGTVMNRRSECVPDYGWPIVWDIVEHNHVETGEKTVEIIMHQKAKRFGVHQIGSAHTGCWMTRFNVMKQVGFDRIPEIRFFDQSWGYKLHKKGHKMAIDWSVKCKHYAKVNNKVIYV